MSKPENAVIPQLVAAITAMPGGSAVDQDFMSDPRLQRALALVLMREAMEALERGGATTACCHLQAAIDSLLGRRAMRSDLDGT